MDSDPWEDDIKRNGAIAAVAVRTRYSDSDRSFHHGFPEHLTQEWIDELVLQAHFVAPVWADYAIVRERPDIWGLGAFVANNVDGGFVFVADDSLVVTCNERVEILITATPIAGKSSVHYQIGFHCLTMSVDAFFFAMSFRDLCQAHGLLAYADNKLIEELALWQTGRGAEAYIEHPDRTRPLFVLQRPTNLPTAARELQRAIRIIYAGFGPVIINDQLFKRYRSGLENPKFGAIGIAPGGMPFPLDRSAASIPLKFYELICACPIGAPLAIEDECEEVGACALAAWNPSGVRPPSLQGFCDGGVELKARWQSVLDHFAPPIGQDIPVTEIADAPPEPKPKEVEKPIALDADGYPVKSDDIAAWSESRFRNQITIVPRARRALSKSAHRDPRRIAEAIELLVGPKLRGYLGEPNTADEFEQGLLKLRMRDGFSNAERLKGQTGADYVIDHGGRSLLLERHLCSNSSGFNDPKMIRIYYVFDKVTRKIVIGWLPSHLRNTQS